MGFKLLMRLIFITILIFNSFILAQHLSLFGTVINKDNRKPIKDMNIYLANTQIGTTTNKNGYFELQNLSQGTFSIILSHISYYVRKIEVRLVQKDIDIGIIELSLKVHELKPILVTGGEDNIWHEQFETFKDNFIGEGRNSDSTIIENPYKIDFWEKDDSLFASCNEPIKIINRSLGYKIIYFLDYFESNDKFTKYFGNAVFLPLPQTSKSDSLRWITNRAETYKGSLRHFLEVLNNGYSKFIFGHNSYKFIGGYSVDTRYSKNDLFLNSNGFFIYHVDNLPWISLIQSSEIPLSTKNLLSEGSTKTERFLKFSNFLRIYYLPSLASSKYPTNYEINNIHDAEGSYLELTKDSVMVDIHGRYFDKFGLHTYGKFGQERISDLLSYEYQYIK